MMLLTTSRCETPSWLARVRFTSMWSAVMACNQFRTEERHDGQSDKVRSEERDDDRQRERGEEKLAHTVKQGDREKYNDGCQRCRQHGQCDFAPACFGCDLW